MGLDSPSLCTRHQPVVHQKQVVMTYDIDIQQNHEADL